MKELIFQNPFMRAVEGHPENVIVKYGDYSATYSQHFERVCRLSGVLRNELGIEKSDRFGILSNNNNQYLELWHAGLLGAAVLNPLNIRLNANEIKYILNDSGAKVIFVDSTFAPVIESIRSDLKDIRHVVLIDNGDVSHDLRYEELIESSKPVMPEEPEETDPCLLMYTGGTTGLPKGVLIDQRSISLGIFHFTMEYKYVLHHKPDKPCCYLLFMPMFHVGALVGMLSPSVSGGKVVILQGFDDKTVIETIEKERVTITGLVPTMLTLILNHPEFRPERLSSLDSIGYGAAPMPEGLLKRLMDIFPHIDISQGYGMTESGGAVTYLSPEDHRKGGGRLRSVGRPMFGVRFSIKDFDGNVLPSGEIGEICIKSGTVMQRYWNQPEPTGEVMKGGWYHSGDMGYLDENGYLYVVDRAKDMIITGGENVYSIEVENAVSTHPAVAQVAAIGIPHEIWGEAIHAIVIPIANMHVTPEEIIEHSRKALSGYKVPKTVEIREEPLPLSAAGKILKRELRKKYWESSND
jgi:long-chain acyl-CoA synthetase